MPTSALQIMLSENFCLMFSQTFFDPITNSVLVSEQYFYLQLSYMIHNIVSVFKMVNPSVPTNEILVAKCSIFKFSVLKNAYLSACEETKLPLLPQQQHTVFTTCLTL